MPAVNKYRYWVLYRFILEEMPEKCNHFSEHGKSGLPF
jgi:hypothetical protein